ncbi:helix-turn-helix domain-containing protein [Lactobacillus johnsonii]|uniref:helix-turn-helix domain-containing protein n=1 Tax=Lactobacillus johnsonii TaxID=33959 RepID=UPI003D787E55
MKTRLKELRMEKGLTQENIAKGFGVTQQAISLYEQGRHEMKLKTLKKIADFFDVSVPYLQGFVDDNISPRDLNAVEKDVYLMITSLIEDYPEGSISQSKIGKLLVSEGFNKE